jgi:hypothetical protein
VIKVEREELREDGNRRGCRDADATVGRFGPERGSKLHDRGHEVRMVARV